MTSLDLFHTANAVVKFVDFGQRLFSDTWHIYRAESGETVTQSNLSAISVDLAHLSGILKKAIEANGDGEGGADDSLILSCNECVALEAEVQKVLQKIGPAFRHTPSSRGTGDNAVFSWDLNSRSFGEAFRAALQSWWREDDIDQLRGRLATARSRVLATLTTGIWVDSLKHKQRDKDVSEKLDTMMAILLESLNVSARSGPMSDEDGNTRSVRQQRSVHHEVTEVSLSESYLFGKISNHIWNKQWKPDPSLLASFPKQTNVTREGLIDFIADTLRFPSMDDREHAISRPFELTYDWVFDLEAPLSDKGVEMWSSLPTWLENKDAVPYWITGKPGSGKSTMMKFITDSAALDKHLQSWSEGRPVYKIRYYAWKPGQELDKSKDGLMRTLMHQMITADPELTPHLFPRRWTLFHMTRNLKRDFFPSWTTWELEESMSRLFDHAEGSSCRIILMIDGLDEFDVAPADICAMIKRIASHACIKVCVASRPWPQFSDTFANSPRLQMHLLTRRDILTFVDGHFRGELAFQQINKVYANGGDRLLAELVEKSQGVFLWIALVTLTLLEALVEGASLSELQSILDSMPSEVETLYDAIFSTIPQRLHPSTSVILQLCAAPPNPMHWATFWLADELREKSITPALPRANFEPLAAEVAFRRRLSARTRGILEIVDHNGTVVYLHRTASEWLKLPRVWQQVKSWSPPNFDPNYCLAGAETILISWEDRKSDNLWNRTKRVLSYASQIDQSLTSDAAVTAVLDQLDSNIKTSPAPKAAEEMKKFSVPELAVQFAILPYIRHQLGQNPDHFSTQPDGEMTWLEQAVMAPAVNGARQKSYWAFSETNMDQRLQVIETLLLHGVRPVGLAELVRANRTRGQRFAREVLKLLEGHQEPDARDPVARDPVPQRRRVRDYFKFGLGRRRVH